ncbi:MAG TPA: hypothetical protein VMZ53_34390 [Kofleriaceae bacterium]|nr:hypothetical protein [Kofleriaceae bacterium]
MRHALIAITLLVGCTDEPAPSGPTATSHIQVADYLEHAPPLLDVLIVVDNTQAMAPYQAKLPRLAADLSTAIHSLARDMADIRIAATTNGGALSPVLSDHSDWFGVHSPSFTGSLESALTPLVDVGATASGPSQPLAAMRTALESSPAFLRPRASLVIVTMSATDDASPSFDYVSFAKAAKSDPANVMVIGIYPPGSTNLDAFHHAFPNRNLVTSIDADDYAPAFADLPRLHRTTLEGSCMYQPADVDLEAPGAQIDCVAMAYDDGAEIARVPMCEGGPPTTGSCWELVAGATSGCSDGSLAFELRGLWTWSLRPAIQLQCVVP